MLGGGGTAISLIGVRDISPPGEQAKLFWSEPQTGFTSGLPTKAPKPEPINHWQRTVRPSMRPSLKRGTTPTDGTLAVRVGFLWSARPASLEQLRATFAKEGIPLEFLSHYEPDGPFACLR